MDELIIVLLCPQDAIDHVHLQDEGDTSRKPWSSNQNAKQAQ